MSLVTFEGHAETPRPAVVETERAERTVEDVPRVGLTPRPAPGQNENRSPWGKKWARNPRGPIFNLHLGFALPIGQRALHFPTGFRIGFSAGYEFRFKRFHFGTLSPLVHVSYTRWGRVAGTLSMQAGARFDHYIPRGRIKWNLWFRSLFGYGHVSGLATSHGFATSHAAGASAHFFPHLGVGLFLEASTVTTEKKVFVDTIVFSLDIGLVIHGKLPF